MVGEFVGWKGMGERARAGLFRLFPGSALAIAGDWLYTVAYSMRAALAAQRKALAGHGARQGHCGGRIRLCGSFDGDGVQCLNGLHGYRLAAC